MSPLMAGWIVVTQFAMEWREREGEGEGELGGLREESASQCRGSLSGMGYRDARPSLVLGSGGRPGLEGEPRVQKWPIGPILTQRGLSLDHRSAAARDSHWGRQTTKGRLTHTHTHTDSEHTHTRKDRRALWKHTAVASLKSLFLLIISSKDAKLPLRLEKDVA